MPQCGEQGSGNHNYHKTNVMLCNMLSYRLRKTLSTPTVDGPFVLANIISKHYRRCVFTVLSKCNPVPLCGSLCCLHTVGLSVIARLCQRF